MDAVGVVLRWLHLVSMATLAGGVILARVLSLPGGALVRARPLLHAAMGLLLLTGFVNYARAMKTELPPSYHMLMGMKIILALTLFALVSLAVSGRRTTPDDAGTIEPRRRTFLTVSVILALVIVLIAGLLRTL